MMKIRCCDYIIHGLAIVRPCGQRLSCFCSFWSTCWQQEESERQEEELNARGRGFRVMRGRGFRIIVHPVCEWVSEWESVSKVSPASLFFTSRNFPLFYKQTNKQRKQTKKGKSGAPRTEEAEPRGGRAPSSAPSPPHEEPTRQRVSFLHPTRAPQGPPAAAAAGGWSPEAAGTGVRCCFYLESHKQHLSALRVQPGLWGDISPEDRMDNFFTEVRDPHSSLIHPQQQI